MKRAPVLVLPFLGAVLLVAGWDSQGTISVFNQTHTFEIVSGTVDHIRWESADARLSENHFARLMSRITQMWNRSAHTNVALQVNQTPSSEPAAFDSDGKNVIFAAVCVGPECGLGTVAHTIVTQSAFFTDCDIKVIDQTALSEGAGPTNWRANHGDTPIAWPTRGGTMSSIISRTMAHEFSHCFGAADPTFPASPCITSSTTDEGPLNCQNSGRATSWPTEDDIEGVRSEYTTANAVAVNFSAGVMNSTGTAVTVTPHRAFTTTGTVPTSRESLAPRTPTLPIVS